MSLKQCQGHQTWYELVVTKQGYNNEKYEQPHLYIVREKANDKVFKVSRNSSIISFEHVRKSKTVVNSWAALTDVLNNPTKVQLNRMQTNKFQLELSDTAVQSSPVTD